MKKQQHPILPSLLVLCLLAIFFSTCKKYEEPYEVKFNVEVDEIGSYSSRITITHNGTNRDLYYGKVKEGDKIDEQHDELTYLYWTGQLEGELFSQRKRVVYLTGLSPKKTYSYFVVGFDKNREPYGIPGKNNITQL